MLFAVDSPMSTMQISLMNFPTKNAGKTCSGLIFAMPDAVNSGVDGNGMSVYKNTNSCTFRPLSASFCPINSMSLFLSSLIISLERAGI